MYKNRALNSCNGKQAILLNQITTSFTYKKVPGQKSIDGILNKNSKLPNGE